MVFLAENAYFGNVLIRGIVEIQLPQPVAWTPTAPGWMAVWAGMGLGAVWLGIRLFLKWRRNRYRRTALQALKKLRRETEAAGADALARLPRLLKQAALHAFPRTRVASLSGEPWIEFLHSRYPDHRLKMDAGRHLLTISYADPKTWNLSDKAVRDLFSTVEKWIRRHRREAPS